MPAQVVQVEELVRQRRRLHEPEDVIRKISPSAPTVSPDSPQTSDGSPAFDMSFAQAVCRHVRGGRVRDRLHACVCGRTDGWAVGQGGDVRQTAPLLSSSRFKRRDERCSLLSLFSPLYKLCL